MECYQRVTKPRTEAPIKQNEVRITTQGLMRNYISYALSLLQEKNVSEIILRAMGRAINKTVLLAEILKMKEEGLHQDIAISSVDITDTWEPLEEGLLPIETARHVSIITITLSKKELDVFSSGYQAPLNLKKVQAADDPKHANNAKFSRGAPRGRARGESTRDQARRRGAGDYNNTEEDNNYNGTVGRSGDGGRRYNGSGRGHYKGYDNGNYNDNGYPHVYDNRYSNGHNGRYDRTGNNGNFYTNGRNGRYDTKGNDERYDTDGNDGRYNTNGSNGRYGSGGYNGNGLVRRGRGRGVDPSRGRGHARMIQGQRGGR